MQSTNSIFDGIENNVINQDLNAGFFLQSPWNGFCNALMSDYYDVQNMAQLLVEGCQWVMEARLEFSRIVLMATLVFPRGIQYEFCFG